MKPLLTIFTPTYNRELHLDKLYESLLKQKTSNFVWLVVDDGSIDNTQSLIRTWMDEKKIDIKYVYQENSGKMIAHNKGVELCETDLFLCLDSDDQLTPNAINDIEENVKKTKLLENDELSGLIFPKIMLNKNESFSKSGMKTTLYDLYNQYSYSGETALLYKTEILRKYPFKLYPGEKFLSEAYVYYQIDDQYHMIYINKGIEICAYQEDGYSQNINKLIRANPNGFAIFFNDLSKRAKTLRTKIGYTKLFIISIIISKTKISRIFTETNNIFLTFIALPYSLYLYAKLHRSNYKLKIY